MLRMKSPHLPAGNRSSGFTLIELMVVVAIIGILAAIAMPSYRNYAVRGQLIDATTLLAAGRADMERYYQDNRTYAAVGGIVPPCSSSLPEARRTQGSFVLTCATATAAAYTLTATGGGNMSAFVFTVDQVDARSTTITGGPSGWSSSGTCWVTKQGQTC